MRYERSSEVDVVRNNSVIMEGITSIYIDQEPRAKRTYMKFAVEAAASKADQGKLLQRLYVDVISKTNIDYGTIPNSNGDLTKVEFYSTYASSADIINKLLKGSKIEEVAIMNNLHDILIKGRADFEYGFKHGVDIIITTYNTMVLTLFDLLNICIVAYAKYLKDPSLKDLKIRSIPSKNLFIVNSAKSFIKVYNGGEWATVMKAFKNKSSRVAGLGGAGTIGTILNTGTVAAGVTDLSASIVLALIALLFAIRPLVYFYYSGVANIRDWIKTQSEFLRVHYESSSDKTAESAQKQKKLLDFLTNVVNFIENKILKSDAAANKQMTESNKTDMSEQSVSSTTDDDFVLA